MKQNFNPVQGSSDPPQTSQEAQLMVQNLLESNNIDYAAVVQTLMLQKSLERSGLSKSSRACSADQKLPCGSCDVSSNSCGSSVCSVLIRDDSEDGLSNIIEGSEEEQSVGAGVNTPETSSAQGTQYDSSRRPLSGRKVHDTTSGESSMAAGRRKLNDTQSASEADHNTAQLRPCISGDERATQTTNHHGSTRLEQEVVRLQQQVTSTDRDLAQLSSQYNLLLTEFNDYRNYTDTIISNLQKQLQFFLRVSKATGSEAQEQQNNLLGVQPCVTTITHQRQHRTDDDDAISGVEQVNAVQSYAVDSSADSSTSTGGFASSRVTGQSTRSIMQANIGESVSHSHIDQVSDVGSHQQGSWWPWGGKSRGKSTLNVGQPQGECSMQGLDYSGGASDADLTFAQELQQSVQPSQSGASWRVRNRKSDKQKAWAGNGQRKCTQSSKIHATSLPMSFGELKQAQQSAMREGHKFS